jgi:hypothetical protein
MVIAVGAPTLARASCSESSSFRSRNTNEGYNLFRYRVEESIDDPIHDIQQSIPATDSFIAVKFGKRAHQIKRMLKASLTHDVLLV